MMPPQTSSASSFWSSGKPFTSCLTLAVIKCGLRDVLPLSTLSDCLSALPALRLRLQSILELSTQTYSPFLSLILLLFHLPEWIVLGSVKKVGVGEGCGHW